jgi:ABC-2 type transport system permease protein
VTAMTTTLNVSRRRTPAIVRHSWSRTVVELKQFTRIPEQVFFTFLLPVLFLVIFSAVFQDDIQAGPGRSVDFTQYFLPGIIASGVMSATFASLAVSISIEQNQGLLKRLAGTPLPKAAYIIGKLGMAMTVTVLQTAIMLSVAVLFFGGELPVTAGRWVVFLLVLAVSAATGAALGIAYTRLIRNAQGAPAIVQPPFLILQFISGVFFRYQDLPGWLTGVASIFPLRWMAQGFRYAFLPDWFGEYEYGSSWGWEMPVLVLLGWLVLSFILAVAFFRWSRDR